MSFYIPLPSNVLSKSGNNVQSNYTTYFPYPLYLNIPYEVALVEFIYREYISFEIGSIEVKLPDTEFKKIDLIAFDNEPADNFFNRFNNVILNSFNNEVKVLDEKYEFKLSQIEYKRPFFEYYKDKKTVDVRVPAKTEVVFSGLAKKIFVKDNAKKDYKFFFDSELLNFFDYIMLYTDIIEHQNLGDSYAPILRTITKNGEFNRSVEKIFTDPHYIPVNKSYINSINIDLRDPSGEQIRFENQLSKVLTKLHFRPIKNA